MHSGKTLHCHEWTTRGKLVKIQEREEESCRESPGVLRANPVLNRFSGRHMYTESPEIKEEGCRES